jgi:hypothetical protein
VNALASKGLRDYVPLNAILWYDFDNAVPSCYTNVSALFSAYGKSVPNICTNPGGTGGSNAHIEISQAAHAHTNHPGCHTHSFVSNSGNNSRGPTGVEFPHPYADPATPNSYLYDTVASHTHTGCWGTCPTPYVNNPAGPHTHAAPCTGTTEPTFRTISYVKHTAASVDIRKNKLPQNSSFLWNEANSAIQCTDTLASDYYGKYLKGVPNGSTAPGTTGGCNTHNHASSGAHAHPVTIGTHSHTPGNLLAENWVGNSPQPNPANPDTTLDGRPRSPFCFPFPGFNHTHTTAGVTVQPTGTSNPTSCNGGHTHSSTSSEPQYHTLALVTRSSVDMRKKGLPTKGIIGWECNHSVSPCGYIFTDGTCGTPDIRDRFVKVIPNACTNPGSQGGTATHSHSSGGSHTHPSGGTHTHTAPGNSNTYNAPTAIIINNSGVSFAGYPICGHTHGIQTVNNKDFGPLACAGSHTHTSASSDPAYYALAYYQKA